MRHLFLIAVTLVVSACASQTPSSASAKTEAAPATKKAPQCWNGDVGTFQDVGTKTTVSGVTVECKPTSDGKAAQWMGAKH